MAHESPSQILLRQMQSMRAASFPYGPYNTLEENGHLRKKVSLAFQFESGDRCRGVAPLVWICVRKQREDGNKNPG